MDRFPNHVVSVVIPVYNMEKYFSETLESILVSDYPDLEIIIIDDGSTDNSFLIAEEYARVNSNIKVFKQENSGPSAARNYAIRNAKGTYILPVDADNLISPTFISEAVKVMDEDSKVKVVAPSAEFIGDRKGRWNLPEFSLNLLARKNIMDTCALYKRKDWERVGGYNEKVGREDWVFWIAMLKDGGKVFRLPDVALYYRIHKESKRTRDRETLKDTIDELNNLYPDFFQRELYGPLRYRRSHSKWINRLSDFIHHKKFIVHPDFPFLQSFILSLPHRFHKNGEVIYKGRNELRSFVCNDLELIVKSYKIPNFINRIVYGIFRSSKAERSYEYALRFQELGIGTPQPIGFITCRRWFLFDQSYFVSLRSVCPFVYNDLANRKFEREIEIVDAIATTTAYLHENGILHKDYSGGNILFNDTTDKIQVEIIDLNRLEFRIVDQETGCQNFERLYSRKEIIDRMGEVYATVRGFSPDICKEKIERYIEIEYQKRQNK